MKFCALWSIIFLSVVDLNLTFGFKCDFDDYYPDYLCHVKPDSSIIKEKHLNRNTDADVRHISYESNLNDHQMLTQSEITPICQRFKNLTLISVGKVKSVDEDLLSECKDLKEFEISYSEIEEIPENLFFDHPDMIEISIARNSLKILLENLFINQIELNVLRIRGNQISCLPSNIFKSLVKLHRLYLDGNNLKTINPKWFERLEFLKLLDLSENVIQDLPENVFAPLTNLVELELSNNQLTTIHSDLFGIHKQLWKMHFINNKINAFDIKVTNKTNLSKLSMTGNVCSDEYINKKEDFNQELYICIKNYKPRRKQSK